MTKHTMEFRHPHYDQDGYLTITGLTEMLNSTADISKRDSSYLTFTPVAINMLYLAYRFLLGDVQSLRTAAEVLKLARSDENQYITDNNLNLAVLHGEIIALLEQSTRRTANTDALGYEIIGMSTSIDILRYAFSHSGFNLFFSTLNWTIMDTENNLVVGPTTLHNTAENSIHSMMSIIEGLMVCLTLFPEHGRRYAVVLNGIALIPTLDSRIQVDVTSIPWREGLYRLDVPINKFSGHYVRNIKRMNSFRQMGDEYHNWTHYRPKKIRTNIPIGSNYPQLNIPEWGYFYGDDAEFLRGFLYFIETCPSPFESHGLNVGEIIEKQW